MSPLQGCLVIAAVVLLFNAGIATGAWVLLSKTATRPPYARTSAAVVGALGGVWLAAPELDYALDRFCRLFPGDTLCGLSLSLPMLFVYPFSLPVTTGLSAWLLAEIIGGRSSKPLFTLRSTIAGALLGAALVFVPLFFIPGFERLLPYPITEPIMHAAPAVGALLALAMAHRKEMLSGEPKRA